MIEHYEKRNLEIVSKWPNGIPESVRKEINAFDSSVAEFTYSFVLYLSVYVFIATKMLYNDAFITNSLVML